MSFLDKVAKHKKLSEERKSSSPAESELTPPPPPAPSSNISVAEQQKAERENASFDGSVKLIDLDLIDVNEQVRTNFDEEFILDLAADIAADPTKQPNNPITVWTLDNGRFLLDAGEHRLRAQRHNREHVSATECGVIRATIKGPVPLEEKDRWKSQVRENVQRKNLNMAELALALKRYFSDEPEANQTQAAEWCGFQNSSSGRKKVNDALQFLDSDEDLFDAVLNGDMSFNKAKKVMKERTREANQEALSPAEEVFGSTESNDDQSSTSTDTDTGAVSQPAAAQKDAKPKKSEKIATAKRQATFSISQDTAEKLIKVVRRFAEDNDLETIVTGDRLDRKTFMDVMNNRLPEIAEILD